MRRNARSEAALTVHIGLYDEGDVKMLQQTDEVEPKDV